MGALGKVTVWRMTEEERLAYIEKHPIVPTEKPKEAKFSTEAIDYKVTNERKKAVFVSNKIMDKVDKEQLHKLFMSDETLPKIADVFNVHVSTLNKFIKEQRKQDPEKWPYRAKK